LWPPAHGYFCVYTVLQPQPRTVALQSGACAFLMNDGLLELREPFSHQERGTDS
jgi:hypothetical protein